MNFEPDFNFREFTLKRTNFIEKNLKNYVRIITFRQRLS